MQSLFSRFPAVLFLRYQCMTLECVTHKSRKASFTLVTNPLWLNFSSKDTLKYALLLQSTFHLTGECKRTISIPESSGFFVSVWSPGETLGHRQSKKDILFEFPRVSPGDQTQTKKPEDSGIEIGERGLSCAFTITFTVLSGKLLLIIKYCSRASLSPWILAHSRYNSLF